MTTLKRLVLLVPVLVSFIVASSAGAATPSPGWTIDSYATPTHFSAADNAECERNVGTENPREIPSCDAYNVTATNAGSLATAEGANITLTDTLPEGVTARKVIFRWSGAPALEPFNQGSPVQSEEDLEKLLPELEVNPRLAAPCTLVPLECKFTLPEKLGLTVKPDDTLTMVVYVTVNEAAAKSLPNSATVSGGGAGSKSTAAADSTNEVNPAPAAFGVSNFDFYSDGLDGARDGRAGDHPYELTTTITLDSDLRIPPLSSNVLEATSVQDLKDVVVDLPLGYVGSILAAPECTFAQLSSTLQPHLGGCPPDTVVGHLQTLPGNEASIDGPIYNMVPEPGYPAEFAYVDGVKSSHVFYVQVVPTPGGYVLQVTNPDVPQISLTHIIATFYGDPAERDGSGNAQIPFFTNPTGCGNDLTATIHVDSWSNPGSYNPDGTPDFNDPAWASAQSVAPPVTGCNALRFIPELEAQPTTREADTPSGLEFELKQPQPEETGSLADSTLRNAVVTLPEGFTVDPSAGDGLAACSEAQIGWVGPSTMNFNPAQPQCPEASKIGSLELSTPLVPGTLEGALYLAAQNANPFGSTLGAYVVVDDPATGVLVKIAGEFLPNPVTGRLTAVFDENPQLPFSDLKLHFFGGPRAELATPETCGTYTTNTTLTPWSLELSELPASPFDSFTIDQACPNGFNPSFTAGSQNLQAGAYTPLVVSFQRSDTDQELQNLSVTLPPGLLADVGSVPLCGEAQANAGTCPEASQVGTVQTGVGPGPNPLFVGGKAYLTGPYNGGPYGLSVVVPAVAGPYDFGTVVVRQSIRIDPTTAQVTDVSDPFPTIIDGIPLRLRRVDVTLNRPGFTFNPTSCAKLAFNGTINGSPLGSPRRLVGDVGYATQPGASSTFTTPFQITNCQTLKFEPKLTASTSGRTSKIDGAGLTYKVSYPKAPQGADADIQYVKVELPSELPSRLTTLQKACTQKQFTENPAGCPSASVIGHAVVHTQILSAPLEGPVYFVSNGGEAFPNLVMVLQGDNVKIDLVGDTLIKNGVTSTTFKTVPDTPFETFEITLPEGKFSALAANANLCKPTVSKTVKKKVRVQVKGKTRTVTRKVKEQVSTFLTIPSDYIAQNGATYNAKVPVTVTGCAKVKVAKKTKKKAKGKAHKK